MSTFRKNWLPSLMTSLLQLLAGGLIYKQEVQPWVENLLGLPRDRLLRAVGYSIGLSVLLLGMLRARVLWPRIRNLAQVVRQRLALLARRRPMDLTPEALPPGTASAIAAAMPNSSWMQWEVARQHQIAVQAAMDSTMHRNVALLDSPHG
jgi:hypothetical protein